MEGVEETRNDNTDGLAQPDSGQAGYPQTGLVTYTQASTNGHGTEQVSIRGVQQVIDNRPEVQNETHVGLGDDRGHLSISNVPGGVQVAVVPSSDEVGVVDGSLASAASAVERTDDASHQVVTAMPADYGLPGPLPTQYVLHEEHEGNEDAGVHGDVDGEEKDRDDILREQDRFLPIANVARIMKKSIPKTGKVSENDQLSLVKRLVSEKLGIPVVQQRLVFKGKTLADSSYLHEYQIVNGSKLHLSIKKPGDGASSGNADDFFGQLTVFIRGHFSAQDTERVMAKFKEDFKTWVWSLSLDDVERMASLHMNESSESH